MNDQQILDSPPKNATNVDVDGDYWVISPKDKPQTHLYGDWSYCELRSVLRSLADISELVELRKANAELKKECNKYKAYYELGRRTEIREAPRG